MTRAQVFRRQGDSCLEQAVLAPDEQAQARLKFLADQWFKIAASEEVLNGTEAMPDKIESNNSTG